MTSLRPHYPQARRQAEAARSHPATRGSRQCRPANACFKWYARAFRRSRSLAVRLLLNYGKVALICATIEAVGLGLIWLAPFSALSLSGAALTGIGYSLVYPGFGVEAVRNAPAQTRGSQWPLTPLFLTSRSGSALQFSACSRPWPLSARHSLPAPWLHSAAGIAAALPHTPCARRAIACS